MARTAIAGAIFLAASVFCGVSLFTGKLEILPAQAAAPQNSSLTDCVLNQSVKKGDTLIELLASAGATPENAARAAQALKKVFDPRKLTVGQDVIMRFESSNGDAKQLAVFSIQLAANRFVEVIRSANGKYHARRTSHPWSPEGKISEHHREGSVITLKARPGSTIGNILRTLNIRERDIDRATKSLGTLFNPRQLRVGLQ